ncbi:MAG TPA: hypothetical protein VE669_11320, partial [Actinomycetota bacterium]|nr:hypothetical protein [Actinomycetota bacterium]
ADAAFSGTVLGKASSTLSGPSEAVAVESGRNDVPVRLTDVDGEPISDARILFEVGRWGPCPEATLFYGCRPDSAESWIPSFRTHGETDADGVATAVFDPHDLEPGDYTLVASYGGSETLRHAIALLPMRVD